MFGVFVWRCNHCAIMDLLFLLAAIIQTKKTNHYTKFHRQKFSVELNLSKSAQKLR